MTLPNSTSKGGPYAGAGNTGPFVVPFYFLQNTDLLVTKTSTLGIDSILTYPADYAVAGVGNPLGGSVTTTANVAVGEKLTVTRNVPLTQGVALPATGPLPSASVETELDKLTMIAQQIQLQLDRSLKLSVSAANAAPSIADFTGFDGTVPIFNNTTKNFDVGPSLTLINASASNAAAAAASAAAALVSQNASAASAASINFRYCGTATGSANALTLTPGAPLTSYTGALLEFIIASANTTEAMTVNASTLGNKNLKQNSRGTKTDPAIGMLQPGMHVLGQYDGTDVVIINAPWDNQASDIAAAATVAFAGVTGNFANLTGTGGPITAMTGLPKGDRFLIRHTGIHTITNSGTLVCLSGANITTAAGDFSEWVSDGTNVYMTRYERASGKSLINAVVVTRQVFTGSGTYTPTSGLIYADIEVWGGGGAGGGAQSGFAGSTGAGGSAGGYARAIANAAAIGASQTVTIGAGGAGNSAAAGSNGGGTSVGAIASAAGGGGGTTSGGAANPSQASGPGTGTIGQILKTGGAGSCGIGTTGSSAIPLGGQGGPTSLGGTAQVTVLNGDTNGAAASTNSGSGGNGASSKSTAVTGGAGGSGYVIITEYCIQ